MKIYVDEYYNIYTEETINKELTRRFTDSYNCDGVFDYIANNYSDSELFAILPPNVQEKVFEDWKARILENDFYEREINESTCPLGKCPYIK